MLDPWANEKKHKASRFAETASQRALFQWANMAASFGLKAAEYPDSYTRAGQAKAILEMTGDTPVYQLKYLFAIHNQGHGDAVRGAMAAAEGLKRGVPDIMCPITIEIADNNFTKEVYKFCGLYIELKRKPLMKPGQRQKEVVHRSAGKASTEQEDWQQFLRSQGYVCEICYGFEEAKDLILKYLKEGGLINF